MRMHAPPLSNYVRTHWFAMHALCGCACVCTYVRMGAQQCVSAAYYNHTWNVIALCTMRIIRLRYVNFFLTAYCRCAVSLACSDWISSGVQLWIHVLDTIVTSFTSGSGSLSSSSSHWLQGKQDGASALLCCRPGWCTTLKVYSANISSHRAICPLGSLKLCSHLRELWSVLVMNLRLYK